MNQKSSDLNPLLTFTDLPPFSQLQPDQVEPAIDTLLAANRRLITQLSAANTAPTWDNLIQPLEEANDRLSRTWSPISHMNSVVNSDALRVVYNSCLPKISEYYTEIGQNTALFHAYQAIKNHPAQFAQLSLAQQKVIDNALRDFHLSGVDLPSEQKLRYKTLVQELSQLSTKYEENLLDATHAWHKHITDATLLQGLPESARAQAQQAAQQKQLTGWLFTLDFPSYHAVITYADNRALRQEMYTAYVTRASDQGPNAGQFDNSRLMEEILARRHELAQLLGYANYAQRSLATKMAASVEQVLDFLHDLIQRSLPAARREFSELETFARDHHPLTALESWDVSYYSEKLRQHQYTISDEELKPYFPETRVIPGLFAIVGRLYGIRITPLSNIDRWHPAVRFYEIRDADNQLRGQFYLDLYAREKKRGGAWMDDCRGRHRLLSGMLQTPVAYLTCNLSPPIGEQPALFTHDEVTTLFHEFGHGLHHMLTQVDPLAVSGINGVAWDAVELPSQFMENWCWEAEALPLITGHYHTGAPLPTALLNKMLAAKNFQSALQMLRQLEFSLFDLRLHAEYDPARGGHIQAILDEVRAQTAVVRPPAFNRFQHGFSHIFAGGYAAGYYSYKWAEVLSADAFAKFEENGIFDTQTGRDFLHTVLEQGGSHEPMELFMRFRGREPRIDALLRHSGIAQ
ncbi:MAG: oligopeptidase A [Gammaproteobacteria bacterium]|nr:oligopeptidase A [Gammaproteobacteria bacterium]